MTKESAIKYLRQIYPNGGHCWLDSQRIEAIEMAITALSHLSLPSNLDEAAEETSQSAYSAPTADGFAIRSFFKRGFKSGAGWMAGQGDTLEVEVKEDAGGYPYIPNVELYDYDKEETLFKPGDKVVVQIRKR